MKLVFAFVLTNVAVLLLLTWFCSGALPSQVNAASTVQRPVSVMIFAHHDADDVANAIASLHRSDVLVHTYNLGTTSIQQNNQVPAATSTIQGKALAFGFGVMVLIVLTGPFFFIFGVIHWILSLGAAQ
jgi:hypothetical protein